MSDEKLFEANINLRTLSGISKQKARILAKNKKMARRGFEARFIPIEVGKIKQIKMSPRFTKRIFEAEELIKEKKDEE
jgi:hypothetical protein